MEDDSDDGGDPIAEAKHIKNFFLTKKYQDDENKRESLAEKRK